MSFPATPLERKKFVDDHVDGWLTPLEGEQLFDLGRAIPPHYCVVEVGSWKGRSASYLGWGMESMPVLGEPRVLHCVDHFRGSDEHRETLRGGTTLPDFMDNVTLAGVAHRINVWACTSREAAAELGHRSISDLGILAVFLDASHDYESLREDIRLWFPLLVPKHGWLYIHDYNAPGWPGVVRATDELLSTGQVWSPTLRDSMIFMQKR